MVDTPRLRIRFTFNRGKVSKAEFDASVKRFELAVVDNVGIKQANVAYNKLKTQVRDKIRSSVYAEIQHITSLYLKFIIGRQRASFKGELTTRTGGDIPAARSGRLVAGKQSLASIAEPWAAWSPNYKKWKEKNFGPPKWFLNRGRELAPRMNAQKWIEWFGPISVKVERSNTKARSVNGKRKFEVGRISVNAFNKITPEMLPALVSGNLFESNPDGRVSGLLDLIGRRNKGVAYRLGGDRATVPYRETLEPFLGFVLTRSLPAAVFARVNAFKGLTTSRVG